MGIEANEMKKIYEKYSKEYDVKWNGRKYDYKNWGNNDDINKAISAANYCLYGICPFFGNNAFW